jgi:hypothetical protein
MRVQQIIKYFTHRRLIAALTLLALLGSIGLSRLVYVNKRKRQAANNPIVVETITPSPLATPTLTPTPSPTVSAKKATPKPGTPTPASTDIGQVFPADNAWNRDISGLPVHTNSQNYLASIGLTTGLHPDFGTVWENAPIGIPYTLVTNTQSKVAIHFTDYGSESDPGPYPIPSNAAIEGGSDKHVIVIDTVSRKLYELFNASVRSDGGWNAASGAVFDLNSNALRPKGWTSADAAGLPIFPGLVRYDEAIEKGEIKHALRFTASKTQKGFINPARHYASSSTDANLPPMGLRVRLKASVNISSYPKEVQVILKAMKTYGLILADNGSNWFVSGAPDSRWNDSSLAKMNSIKGSDFEVVDTGPIEQ